MKTQLQHTFLTIALAAGLLLFPASKSQADDSATPNLTQALLGGPWSWAHSVPTEEARWTTVLTFHSDGTASNTTNQHTWYWWVVDPQTVHLQFEPEIGPFPTFRTNEGMNLTFNADRTAFRGLPAVPSAEIVATGYRQGLDGNAVLATLAADAPTPGTGLTRFYDELPATTDLVFTPLEQPVPDKARKWIARYEEELLWEAARSPRERAEAYRASLEICRRLDAALNEREAWLKRNVLWNGGIQVPESWRKAWADRVAAMAPELERSRDVLRGWVGARPETGSKAFENRLAVVAHSGGKSASIASQHVAPRISAHAEGHARAIRVSAPVRKFRRRK